MGETGKVRGIKGWSRSGPDLRKSPLAIEEIHGFIDSHLHLSREEGEKHGTSLRLSHLIIIDAAFQKAASPITTASVRMQVPALRVSFLRLKHSPRLIRRTAYSQLLMSPANTDTSSDFSLSGM